MVKEIIQVTFGMAMFINAALFIPQAIKILRTKEAKDLSLIMFGGFCLIQASAVAYGYIQHDFYMAGVYSLSLLSCGFVTFLIFLYRNK